MGLVKATKGAKKAVFSERAWSSGQPQRYGWHSEDEVPLKKLPTEILEFAQIRKKVQHESKQELNDEQTIPAAEKAEQAAKPKPKAKRKPKAKKA